MSVVTHSGAPPGLPMGEGTPAIADLPSSKASPSGQGMLIIACGALAHEIIALTRANGWEQIEVRCLPAELHNRPERIPAAVRALVQSARCHFQSIFVAYGDCGTGGLLDAVLKEEGIERIPGAHCYEFFATGPVFAELAEAEPGTFYLTDFLLRHFDRLVLQGLGLDKHPELFPTYFGNYRRLVYLAQAPKSDSVAAARAIAERMGLKFESRETGYGDLATTLVSAVTRHTGRRDAARNPDARRPDARGSAGQDQPAGRDEEAVAWHR